jgi:hypothetical protein
MTQDECLERIEVLNVPGMIYQTSECAKFIRKYSSDTIQGSFFSFLQRSCMESHNGASTVVPLAKKTFSDTDNIK